MAIGRAPAAFKSIVNEGDSQSVSRLPVFPPRPSISEFSLFLRRSVGPSAGRVWRSWSGLDFRSYEATRWGLTCWFAFCSGVA